MIHSWNPHRRPPLAVLCYLLWVVVFCPAHLWAETPTTQVSELVRKTWMIAGVEREAWLHLPKKTQGSSIPVPVVFVFHGHGGTAPHAARGFHVHQEWPEALVIYPQGVPTPGHITDPEGKQTGWQRQAGDQQDRDLTFYDAMLKSLRQEYQIDPGKVFATGHSNGGAFAFLLWAERGDTLAGVAPSAAAAPKQLSQLRPKPYFHLAGTNDPLVKFSWQQHTILHALAVCQCTPPRSLAMGEATYPSQLHFPVQTYIHESGHRLDTQTGMRVVKFFQEVLQSKARSTVAR